MKCGSSKKILVLRYRFIGDTILTVPFLRNLRRAEPDAYIAWVVAPGSIDAVRGIPYVDEFIFWDPVTIHADSRGAHRGFADKLAYMRELRKMRFDKVYVLKRSLSSAVMAFLSGARERIGFNTEGRGFLLTKRVPYRNDQHEVRNFLDVLRADGIEVADDHLESWIAAEEDESALGLLERAGVDLTEKLAAFHMFSSITQRGWPHANFALLAARLKASGYRVLIMGGSGDRQTFDEVRSLFAEDVVDLVGSCNLRVTMALLRKCTIFVGNDSGIMHLAAAAGIPVVSLFGPQSPVKFGPWSEKSRVIYKSFACSPCRQKFFTECEPSERQRPACVEVITVDEVFRECMTLLPE